MIQYLIHTYICLYDHIPYNTNNKVHLVHPCKTASYIIMYLLKVMASEFSSSHHAAAPVRISTENEPEIFQLEDNDKPFPFRTPAR